MVSGDDVWRRQRKMHHLRLNVKVASQYVPYQVCHNETEYIIYLFIV